MRGMTVIVGGKYISFESVPALAPALPAVAGSLTPRSGRSERLMRRVLQSSEFEPSEARPVPLREVTEGALRLARSELDPRVVVSRRYAPELFVKAEPRVLSWLIARLIIDAGAAVLTSELQEIVVEATRDQGAVVLRVADWGTRRALSVLDQLAEPLPPQIRARLGHQNPQASCYDLLRDWHGQIMVRSRENHGTTLTLTLLARNDAGRPGRAVNATDAGVEQEPGRRGRILVVDDEPPITRALRRMLHRDHDVVLCESGSAALALLGSDSDFDVILCDLMMPQVSGMELHRRLSALDSGLERRVIFMTGGVFSEDDRAFLDGVENLCVNKPIDRDALRQIVARRVGQSLQRT